MKPTQICLALATLLGGIALAQPALDTDGDGAVSLKEFQDAQAARAAENFSRLDTDGNGQLSMEEMHRRPRTSERAGNRERDARGPGRAFGRIDSDHNGSISLPELETRHPDAGSLFSALDTDTNGLLSPGEWRDGREAIAASMHERMASIDSDGDGAWSLAEIQAAQPSFTQDRFTHMDRNNDGLLTADERPGFGRRRDHDGWQR
jgi:Ca2+-binding EF-hand superfamily protein